MQLLNNLTHSSYFETRHAIIHRTDRAELISPSYFAYSAPDEYLYNTMHCPEITGTGTSAPAFVSPLEKWPTSAFCCRTCDDHTLRSVELPNILSLKCVAVAKGIGSMPQVIDWERTNG